MKASEVLNQIKFKQILYDVVMGNITTTTIDFSNFLLKTEFGDYDFINRLAGISEKADMKDATEVVIEGLIYDLKGGDHGNTGIGTEENS